VRTFTISLLSDVLRATVISTLGTKLARGRSPVVVALISLLVSRALANRTGSEDEAAKRNQPPSLTATGGRTERAG
jgi:hypothetical protein